MKREFIQVFLIGCLTTTVSLGFTGYVYELPTVIIDIVLLSILFVLFVILYIILNYSLSMTRKFDEMSRRELAQELDRRKAEQFRLTEQEEIEEIRKRIDEKLDNSCRYN